MLKLKTTATLVRGDVLEYGDATDIVRDVTMLSGGVMFRVDVLRRWPDGRQVDSFFYAGRDGRQYIIAEDALD